MDFSRRASELRERMDDPQADETLLFNTFAQFDRINRMLAAWSTIFKRHMLPIMRTESRSWRVLDIGGGGGDVLLHLYELAEKHQLVIDGHLIEPDERAIRFYRERKLQDPSCEQVTAKELVERGEQYDFVISNHVVHHLDDTAVTELCDQAARLAKHRVIFNDIHRSRIGYHLFKSTMPLLFRNSFIIKDGGISIQRSFKPDELKECLPADWQVETLFPFRILAMYEA